MASSFMHYIHHQLQWTRPCAQQYAIITIFTAFQANLSRTHVVAPWDRDPVVECNLLDQPSNTTNPNTIAPLYKVHSNLNDQTNTKQGGTHLSVEESFPKWEDNNKWRIYVPDSPFARPTENISWKTVDSVNTLCTPTAQF